MVNPYIEDKLVESELILAEESVVPELLAEVLDAAFPQAVRANTQGTKQQTIIFLSIILNAPFFF